jgi:hypothetical protein
VHEDIVASIIRLNEADLSCTYVVSRAPAQPVCFEIWRGKSSVRRGLAARPVVRPKLDCCYVDH